MAPYKEAVSQQDDGSNGERFAHEIVPPVCAENLVRLIC